MVQLPQNHYKSSSQKPAGSGKSYLINAIKALLKDTCILTGTTGLAGYNIEGCTLHSALQLPVCNYNNNDLQGTALQRLQLRFSGKQYLITDEMSMLGQRTLAWVDKRLRQATGKLNEPLWRDFRYAPWRFHAATTCWR